MEKLGDQFRHSEDRFDYFKKDGQEYKIDTYDKEDNVAYILDRKQLFNTVDQSIPISYREDWIRFVNRFYR